MGDQRVVKMLLGCEDGRLVERLSACPVTSYGISCAEPSSCTTRDTFVNNYDPCVVPLNIQPVYQ
jgi:hypothetical protein